MVGRSAIPYMHPPLEPIFFIGATAISTGFANGAGHIWLDNVQCHGTETRLIDCPWSPLGTHSCVHSDDAGVRCTTTGSSIPAYVVPVVVVVVIVGIVAVIFAVGICCVSKARTAAR